MVISVSVSDLALVYFIGNAQVNTLCKYVVCLCLMLCILQPIISFSSLGHFPPNHFHIGILKSLYTKNQNYINHNINFDLKEKVFENQTKKAQLLKKIF